MATSTLTAIFTVLSFFGLIAVSAWFALENWLSAYRHAKRWILDVLIKHVTESLRDSKARHALRRTQQSMTRGATAITDSVRMLASTASWLVGRAITAIGTVRSSRTFTIRAPPDCESAADHFAMFPDANTRNPIRARHLIATFQMTYGFLLFVLNFSGLRLRRLLASIAISTKWNSVRTGIL